MDVHMRVRATDLVRDPYVFFLLETLSVDQHSSLRMDYDGPPIMVSHSSVSTFVSFSTTNDYLCSSRPGKKRAWYATLQRLSTGCTQLIDQSTSLSVVNEIQCIRDVRLATLGYLYLDFLGATEQDTGTPSSLLIWFGAQSDKFC
jgi:hypothetical protein